MVLRTTNATLKDVANTCCTEAAHKSMLHDSHNICMEMPPTHVQLVVSKLSYAKESVVETLRCTFWDLCADLMRCMHAEKSVFQQPTGLDVASLDPML
jgi:hypothetical protein